MAHGLVAYAVGEVWSVLWEVDGVRLGSAKAIDWYALHSGCENAGDNR